MVCSKEMNAITWTVMMMKTLYGLLNNIGTYGLRNMIFNLEWFGDDNVR